MGLYISLLVGGVVDVLCVLPFALTSHNLSISMLLLGGMLAALSGLVGYFWNLE